MPRWHMTWKGTFYTEYACSLCGSSLALSLSLTVQQTLRRSSPTSSFPFVPFVGSSRPHTLFGNPTSLALHRRLVATFPASLRLYFSSRSSCFHTAFFRSWPSLFCPPALLWCSLCKAWRFFGDLKLCRCVCVSIQSLLYLLHMK